MELITRPGDMQAWSDGVRRSGSAVAFVPTMGALHEGHLELMRVAALNGTLVVSIFVNPMQFNRSDDFDAYPRPIEDDLDICRAAGAQAVYAPTARTMYPDGFETRVEPGSLAAPMEGAGRPGHFAGVTTVVTKLFNAVRPDVALFGQKDYQQLAIIRRMTRDLDFGIGIIGVPTVRESDGVALSSRNRRLTPDDRLAARCVPASLGAVARAFEDGERTPLKLQDIAEAVVAAEPRARLEYITLADAYTLEPVVELGPVTVVAAAVWFGDVRLIDNVVLSCEADTRPAADNG
jgi:pantoate--beta-alanine ligase